MTEAMTPKRKLEIEAEAESYSLRADDAGRLSKRVLECLAEIRRLVDLVDALREERNIGEQAASWAYERDARNRAEAALTVARKKITEWAVVAKEAITRAEKAEAENENLKDANKILREDYAAENAKWSSYVETAETLSVENEKLKRELDIDRAVCACGCPPGDHESYGEDGESCEHDDHECLRVAPAVLQMLEKLRAGVSLEKEGRIGVQRSVAQSAGGLVEGQPTSSINYLQRIRELVATEADVRDMKSFIVKMRGKVDPKEWRGIDDVTARAVLSEAECKQLRADNAEDWKAQKKLRKHLSEYARRSELEVVALNAEVERLQGERLWVVFDGPPSHESGRFVEIENEAGASVGGLEWKQDGELWRLGPFVMAYLHADKKDEATQENFSIKARVCPKCSSENVETKELESACGGYDDYKHACLDCHESWHDEGPDA